MRFWFWDKSSLLATIAYVNARAHEGNRKFSGGFWILGQESNADLNIGSVLYDLYMVLRSTQDSENILTIGQ